MAYGHSYALPGSKRIDESSQGQSFRTIFSLTAIRSPKSAHKPNGEASKEMYPKATPFLGLSIPPPVDQSGGAWLYLRADCGSTSPCVWCEDKYRVQSVSSCIRLLR